VLALLALLVLALPVQVFVLPLLLRLGKRFAENQFTCFTSTKVQMLTQRRLAVRNRQSVFALRAMCGQVIVL
jgi:hypothetical protein